MMNANLEMLIAAWKYEEQQPFIGWDFSYLDGRMLEGQPPWSYLTRAAELMRQSASVVDLDTGGGERFLKLRPHWPPKVVVTESYPPNFKLATERLTPFGAQVLDIEIGDFRLMPFADNEFDLVLNRHAAFNAAEVARILTPGGTFLTQQVHGLWAADLLAAFDAKPQWPNATPEQYLPRLLAAGLEIIDQQNWSGELAFTDVGAIVYYLKAVPWLVPGFSVETHLKYLLKLQEQLENKEKLVFSAGNISSKHANQLSTKKRFARFLFILPPSSFILMKRTDIHTILVPGSGAIVIGQAAEFDYSGTQAVKALRAEGYRVVLVNSNPATIMTDPEIADATYIEPLTPEALEAIIAQEKPDAMLPTVGGQTALNLALALSENGVLEKYGVQLIGAKLSAIKAAEDRLLFRETMQKAGIPVPRGGAAYSLAEAEALIAETGYPVLVRASFAMGGTGASWVYEPSELKEAVRKATSESPIGQAWLEESVQGWKEYELEVMRDKADNFVVVCSIENLDAMGVHTGDSITVAPAQTLTDREYQILRDLAHRVLSAVGVETGGSNVQFGVDPKTGRVVVIEMNPRVSRSSALASKATGFPIAKLAALVAVGYTLDEITNDITKQTKAAFEPSLDYVVVKIPRWAFEKFPGVDPTLGPQMKSGRRGHGTRADFPRSAEQGDSIAGDWRGRA